MSDADRLPDELIDMIHASDTVALATYYHAKKKDELFFPSHVGHNMRGGRQGFVRAKRSDGRTVVVPDYSGKFRPVRVGDFEVLTLHPGNRLLTSLGNIETTPQAGLTFVSFTEGHILYLTGKARTIVGQEAQEIMPRQNVLTTVYVTGFVFIKDALTLRQRPGTEVGRSPYSPPVKFLAEELKGTPSALFNAEVTASLASVEIHSPDLATFTWNASKPLLIQPGQTAVLDFKELLGSAQYSHMAPWNPASINDDRVRTWTVSRADAPPPGKSSRFALTMREKKGGTVTGALFAIARKLAAQRPDLLEDSTPLGLKVGLVGVVGEFTLDEPPLEEKMEADPPKPLLWIAGGIGVTPFLAMLTALTTPPPSPSQAPPANSSTRDINLVVSTREPEILSSLIVGSIHSGSPALIRLTLDIFTNVAFELPSVPSIPLVDVMFRVHVGRVDEVFVKSILELARRAVYLCGPPAFERSVMDALSAHGVDKSAIRREGFEY